MTRGFAALLLASSIGSAATIATYVSPKRGAIHSACVLPIQAELSRYGMKGGEGMTKESDEWAARLGGAVTQALKSSGIEVTADLSSDPSDDAVIEVQNKFASVSVQLRKKPGKVKEARYTLGDAVALLPCAAQADTLVFVQGRGIVLSGGRKAFTVLTQGAASLITAHSNITIWMTIVDAKSGDVWAVTRIFSLGDGFNIEPEKSYSPLLEKELGEITKPVSPKKSAAVSSAAH